MKRETCNLNCKGKKIIGIILIVIGLLIIASIFLFKIPNRMGTVDKEITETQTNGELKSGEVVEKIPDERENLKMDNLDFKISSGEDIKTKDELNINGLKAINFKIGLLENSTLITGELENTTNKPIQNIKLLFIMYDSNGNVVHQSNIILPETIEPKEVRSVETSIGVKYENISSIDAKIVDSEISQK